MKCVRADILMQHALDGRLSSAGRAALDTHLAQCAACRAASDEYRTLSQTTARWARETALPDDAGRAFTDAVMAQIAAGQGVPSPRLGRQTLTGTLCGALLLAVLSVWVGPHLPLLSPHVGRIHLTPLRPLFAPSDLTHTLLHLPQDAAALWGAVTAKGFAPPRWTGSALAACAAVNLFFVQRARRASREALPQ